MFDWLLVQDICEHQAAKSPPVNLLIKIDTLSLPISKPFLAFLLHLAISTSMSTRRQVRSMVCFEMLAIYPACYSNSSFNICTAWRMRNTSSTTAPSCWYRYYQIFRLANLVGSLECKCHMICCPRIFGYPSHHLPWFLGLRTWLSLHLLGFVFSASLRALLQLL